VNAPPSTSSELDNVLAHQRYLRESIASERVMIAAIKASTVYRVVQMARRVVPRPTPVLTEKVAAPSKLSRTDAAAVDALAERLAREWEEVGRLERESRQVHHELHHLQLSRPLRFWRATRRRLQFVGHPLWAVGAAWRIAVNGRAVNRVGMAWRRLRWHELRFRFVAPVSQQTDVSRRSAGGAAADAIRWLAPVRISGETRHPLLMQPNSSTTFRVKVPARSQVVTDCALLPGAWAENRDGVTFDLQVTCATTGAERRRTMHLNPGARLIERRWQTLGIDPPSGCEEVLVKLTTSLPHGGSRQAAFAVWGEPRIQWARSDAEMWRSVVVLTRRLKDTGLSETLRYIRGVQAGDEHATLYREWIAAHTPTEDALRRMREDAAGLAFRPRFSILTPVYNTHPGMLRACIDSVINQAYPDWELCLADDGSTSRGTQAVLNEYEGHPQIRMIRLASNSGISLATHAALELATGDFIALLDHDDELAPEALFEMASVLAAQPDLDFIYSDEDKLGGAGERCDPYFKPDWSPEHFLSCMYTCHLMVLRTSLVREVGGFRAGFDGSQDYDIVLRVIERTGRIHHVPKILYHWRKSEGSVASSGLAKTWAVDAGQRALEDHVARTGTDAVVIRGPAPGLFRMRYRIRNRPLVSIIVPTAGRTRDLGDRVVDLLPNCLGSVADKTTYDNYEIVLGDDGSLPDHIVDFLATLPVPVTRVSFPPREDGFNYGRKLNFMARHGRGEHFILFNDDTEVINGEWMEALLEFSQQEEIGAVGPKLWFGDGRLQHIGMVVGVNGMVAHAFHGHPGSSPGYGFSAQIIRNYSSVTGACLMTKRALFERFGGFDDRFQFDFNDVNYCLKCRQAGLRVVFTPYAQLYHLEMATWGSRPWHPEEVSYMLRTWADVYARDPYYNPNLTREHCDYRVHV
jgi:GT2 family glycosyltransferase